MEASMDRDEALFVNLVMIFKSAAMQQMGKIINPLTGKVERNLEQARFSIDTIAMLKDKTSGNISVDLVKLLDSVLLELRMNFVEETRVGDSGTAAGESAGTADAQAPGSREREAAGAGGGAAGASGADEGNPGEGEGAADRRDTGPGDGPEGARNGKKPR